MSRLINRISQMQLKLTAVAVMIGLLAGSASALFLFLLDIVTNFREAHFRIIAFLPVAGFLIGWVYHHYGTDVAKGNNRLIEEFHEPRSFIPMKMAPLVLWATLMTHLFGGSAGREGTAVQIGGSVADQFSRWFNLGGKERKVILICGISAGFASVFGTPLAGFVFAFEVLRSWRIVPAAMLPSLVAAFVAHFICLAWGVVHTPYVIFDVPAFSVITALWTALAGAIFGAAAFFFVWLTSFFTERFLQLIAYAPLRPFAGGGVLACIILFFHATEYAGLGILVIVRAFSDPLSPYAFAIKILFTAFTLGAGFKGGEVTPLFFIGAALGNALVWFIPLPLSLLAGMGFVAVFAGAAHAPLACVLLGVEVFGPQSAAFLLVACLVAYICSGSKGIYHTAHTSGRKGMIFSGLFSPTKRV